MSHTDHRALIDKGRKAGLNTSELYSALTASPPERGDAAGSQTDSNGFISAIDAQGHISFRPPEEAR